MDTTIRPKEQNEQIVRCSFDDTVLMRSPNTSLQIRVKCSKCSRFYSIKIENGDVTVKQETKAT